MEDYRHEKFRELLESDAVTEPTRKVLFERLKAGEGYVPRFFEAQDYSTLLAVCAVLAPTETVPSRFVPSEIDKRLADGQGNGWRYAKMPPDTEAFRRWLRGLNEIARQKFNLDFAILETERQNEILQLVRRGEIRALVWQDFDCKLFLEELLVECAEIFYSHPLAQEEIGYVGFADARGWQKIGLNQHDAIEVQSLKSKVQSQETQKSDEDLTMRHYSPSEIVDAVVIGTGAGGAPILARLAQAGLKVVALEAGKHFDYHKFATDEREQVKLFWLDERLSAGSTPVYFGSNNSGCGVGGSTVHFTAYTPRAQADDFRLFSEFGTGRDWCLSFDEIEPFYDEVEWFLGVSGATPYPWGKSRKRGYPLPPLPLNGAAQLMRRACAKLGIETSPAPNAALSQNYFREEIGWRAACTNRGFCQAGCSIGAKGSTDATFIPLAIKHGAEIRAESFVTEFEIDSRGKIKSVVYTREGKTERQLCRNVFLCAGAIETPRLLLINNLANRSGQIGRNFMAHPGVQVWGVFDEEIYPHKGIPGGLISEDTHRPQKRFEADFVGGYLLQSIGVMPVTYVSQLARAEKVWGAELGAWMNDYNHTAGINILGECLPYDENYLELSDEKDERGLPKPLVHFSHGENEEKMTAHAEKLMRKIWAAAGAKKMWTFQRNAHIIGTCRMGEDASDSVVNRDGQSFDVPNLYICDNSIFPSALSVNPALTIMALALRTADRFLGRL
ncbi:MAG TPA: GMC family oxidoreductase [Pyrinomonadaceae bacterium]|jgi:choline dehydrogenase-like flavoprotein